MKVTDFVFTGAQVSFDYYRAEHFYYRAYHIATGEIYSFPVPLDDVGGTLLNLDKAVTFMRWIRRAIQDGTLIKVSNEAEKKTST